MRRRTACLLLAATLIPAAVLATAIVAAAAPSGPAPAAALTQRASVDSAEQQYSTYHDDAAISANGRYVAFTQGGSSVFVRDRTAGVTELIADDLASAPDLSADGNLVAFTSIGFGELYVYNRATDLLEVLFPVTGCYSCYDPALSGSGALVAFDSLDADLVAGDTNGVGDVFVHNRGAATTERISVSSSEAQANAVSSEAAISADGRFVVFRSDATNLVSGDTNGKTDVFIRNLAAGTTQRVSLDSAETQGNDFANAPDISGNGRYVTFDAKSSNWPGSTGSVLTYVRDRTAGTTETVSVSSAEVVADNRFGNGTPVISDNGRFVSFSSNAGNLVAGDTGVDQDVFLRDRTAGTTTQVSVSTSGVQSNGGVNRTPAISATGAIPFVAFVSSATNLVTGDTNGFNDIYVRKTA